MTLWKKLPGSRTNPEKVFVLVECPRGSSNIYELTDYGVLKQRETLPPSVTFPGDYGLVTACLNSLGKPMTALVLSESAAYPGVVIDGRPIGMIRVNVGDIREEKLICVPAGPKWRSVKELKDIGPKANEIEAFFEATLGEVEGFANAKDALKAAERGAKLFKERFG